MQHIESTANRVIDNVSTVIVGKQNAIELVVIALLSSGHVLIEDVPGVGKTTLAKSIARSLGLTFNRIQFTPDLLPSDVTGVTIFNQQTSEFEFRHGPVMSQIVLADEVNRATPKTQSALLEAMEENQTTVDGKTHALPEPFLVFATQNPIEYEGTFPLPEAQLDRFLLRVNLGYPDREHELKILGDRQREQPIDTVQPVIDANDIRSIQNAVQDVYVDELVYGYIVDIVRATRKHPDIYLGASPRASLGLFRSTQALAAIRGRGYVVPDDVKHLAESVIAHRIIVSPAARIRNIETRNIVFEILDSVPVPGASAT
ncbi:MAG: AAA family ATPase [Chloroflexi bacterium]|nr:AAA family ATPase [Chloroflexota bacterium]HCU72283.1 AAA family ATPase [Chloroflexota bacterium]|tara:strand:- start:9955 stop:10902 length:948 start_codon:yes stop_codon:yes gene_type:complete